MAPLLEAFEENTFIMSTSPHVTIIKKRNEQEGDTKQSTNSKCSLLKQGVPTPNSSQLVVTGNYAV
jgi:hypothetical protein